MVIWKIRNIIRSDTLRSTAIEKGVSMLRMDLKIHMENLTHWGLVTPYGDSDLGQHWLR